MATATSATTQTTWTIPGTDIVLDQAAMEDRRRRGVDIHDEVWDGVIHVSPLANDNHQRIVTRLATILSLIIDLPGLGHVRAGVNLSDRERNWKQNFRVPDIAVFLNGTSAKNCDTHWCGGPDFAVEIRSPGDETLEKIPFYQKVGTRELLVIDRDPWSLVLYRLGDEGFVPAGRSDLDTTESISSAVVPLTFRLVPTEGPNESPVIEVTYPAPNGQNARLTI